MEKRYEIQDEDLENVVGGKITYTWDGSTGTIGLDGNNAYILVDKSAFVSYYKSVQGTMSDVMILKNLLSKGIAKRK